MLQHLTFLKYYNLDKIPVSQAHTFAVQFASYIQSVYPDIYNDIFIKNEITDKTRNSLLDIGHEFSKIFVPKV